MTFCPVMGDMGSALTPYEYIRHHFSLPSEELRKIEDNEHAIAKERKHIEETKKRTLRLYETQSKNKEVRNKLRLLFRDLEEELKKLNGIKIKTVAIAQKELVRKRNIEFLEQISDKDKVKGYYDYLHKKQFIRQVEDRLKKIQFIQEKLKRQLKLEMEEKQKEHEDEKKTEDDDEKEPEEQKQEKVNKEVLQLETSLASIKIRVESLKTKMEPPSEGDPLGKSFIELIQDLKNLEKKNDHPTNDNLAETDSLIKLFEKNLKAAKDEVENHKSEIDSRSDKNERLLELFPSSAAKKKK